MSTAAEVSDASLQSKAQLSGLVDINFKSDYLPLEKMADSFQIGMIQNASKPGRKPEAGVAPGAGAGAASPPPTTTTPAGASPSAGQPKA
ncbi:hypothetical protein [Tunturiibacter gelidiferens]|uniref:hypothetical protein n=1 Tax=Tunturiibacter gelidiferens TaxID=3069689 RepID=UPI003D9BB1F8